MSEVEKTTSEEDWDAETEIYVYRITEGLQRLNSIGSVQFIQIDLPPLPDSIIGEYSKLFDTAIEDGLYVNQTIVLEQVGADELETFNSSELIRDRLLASIDWLQQADREGYTVQFITDGMDNLDFAETILSVLDRAELLEESYLCVTTGDSNSFWTIKYGNFSGLTPAQKFVDELPAVMHEFRPFVQNMSVVECNTNTTIAALILE